MAANNEPLILTCSRCKEKIVIGPANCVAHIFVYQLYFSKVHVICPHCEFEVFLFATRSVLAEFLRAKVGQIVEAWADDETVEAYEKVHGVSVPEPRNLTEKELALLKYAAWEMENSDVLEELDEEG